MRNYILRSSDSACNDFSNSWEHFQTRVSSKRRETFVFNYLICDTKDGVQGISNGAVGSQTVLPSASSVSVQDQAGKIAIDRQFLI